MSDNFSSADMLSFAGGAIGAGLNYLSGRRAAKRERDRYNEQVALQKEFAQNSIRWRVQDAKAAGLHPLAALGVSASQYHPVSTSPVGGQDFSWLGDSLGSMGQNIDRAREAGMTKAARAKAEQISDQQIALGLRHQELQNQVLEMEIASKKARLAQMTGPAMPSPYAVARDGTVIKGQGDSFSKASISAPMKVEPAEITANEPGFPSQEAGSSPEYSFTRLPGGGYAPKRQVGGQDPYEEDWLGGFAWNVRNRILPMFYVTDAPTAPPRSWLPDGYDEWLWNTGNQAWYPSRKRDGFFTRARNHYIPR